MLVIRNGYAAGWNCSERCTRARGERMVELGLWIRWFDEHGEHVGYLVTAERAREEKLPSQASSCCITRHEMELVAGLHGKSRTVGLNEIQREERMKVIRAKTGRQVSPEDAVERALAKLEAFRETRLR